jgi:hypothetical protein
MNTINSPTATNLSRGTIIELAHNVYNNALAAQEQADRAQGIVAGVGAEVERAKAEADRAGVASIAAEAAALSAEAAADRAQSLVEEIFSNVYPVGCIYVSVNEASPAMLFGGTWEKIKDRFLLASGDTYAVGETGGSADSIIVAHNHTFTTLEGSGGGDYPQPSATSGFTNYLSSETQSTGESGVGKNMPPYFVVNVWKRVE